MSKFVLVGQAAPGKYITLDPRSNADFQKAVAMFGTVDLVAAEAQVTVAGLGGWSGLVAAGFVPSSETPTQHLVRQCTTSIFVPQSPEGSVHNISCDLSVFGNELKGVIHANDPPKFVVWPTGFTAVDTTVEVAKRVTHAPSSSVVLVYARLTITIATKSAGARGGDSGSGDQ